MATVVHRKTSIIKRKMTPIIASTTTDTVNSEHFHKKINVSVLNNIISRHLLVTSPVEVGTNSSVEDTTADCPLKSSLLKILMTLFVPLEDDECVKGLTDVGLIEICSDIDISAGNAHEK